METKFYHILFLPLFGVGIEDDILINLIAVVAFMGVYVWHVRHDHKHSQKMIDEIRLLRKDINRMKKL